MFIPTKCSPQARSFREGPQGFQPHALPGAARPSGCNGGERERERSRRLPRASPEPESLKHLPPACEVEGIMDGDGFNKLAELSGAPLPQSHRSHVRSFSTCAALGRARASGVLRCSEGSESMCEDVQACASRFFVFEPCGSSV